MHRVYNETNHSLTNGPGLSAVETLTTLGPANSNNRPGSIACECSRPYYCQRYDVRRLSSWSCWRRASSTQESATFRIINRRSSATVPRGLLRSPGRAGRGAAAGQVLAAGCPTTRGATPNDAQLRRSTGRDDCSINLTDMLFRQRRRMLPSADHGLTQNFTTVGATATFQPDTRTTANSLHAACTMQVDSCFVDI